MCLIKYSFELFISIRIYMYFFNELLSINIIIYCNVQFVLNLAKVGSPFNDVCMPFEYILLILWEVPCFFIQNEISGFSCNFLVLPGIIHFSRHSNSFWGGNVFRSQNLKCHCSQALLVDRTKNVHKHTSYTCTFIHTDLYSSVFLYLFLYIENHESRLIAPIPIPHHKAHPTFPLFVTNIFSSV